MPKSSNESSRQMLEYIKKVAAAGRGGDTKLAYLSSSARQLLKDLGGAGTKNPKTKLPEYRRRRFLEEGEVMEPSAGAPPAAPAFQPPPVMPEPPPVMPEPPAAMTPIASEPPQAPPMDPRDFRLAQEPRPMFSGMLPRNARQEFDEIAAPAPVAQADPVSVAPTPEPAVGSSAADLEELGRSLSASGMTAPPGLEEMLSTLTPGSLSSARESILPPAPQEPAPTPSEGNEPDPRALAAQREEELESERRYKQQEADRRAALDAYAMEQTRIAREEAQRFITEAQNKKPEPMPEPSETRASVRAGEDLSVTAAQRDAEVRRAADAQRRVEEGELARRRDEELRRAAEEEAARRQAEEAAARRAQEEAARAAQEEASRRAQEEAARKAAQEEAARVAQDAAARKAAQDAAAARQAEEEAARKAAEDAARVQPPIAPPAQPPIAPPAQPPVTQPPPGLINSPIQQPPAAPPPPPSAGIIVPPPSPPGLETPNIRTGEFIDKNLNGIDDRDEPPPSAAPVIPAPPKRKPEFFIPDRFFDDNTDIGRLLKRVGGGRSVSRGPSTKGGLKRGAPKPPVDQIPGADRPRPVRPEPPVGLFPEPPGGDQPTIPVQPPPNIPVRGPESQIPVRPLPGPLPTPIGAGTPTPYFNPNAGGLTPGTVPVSQMPESLKTSKVPLDAIARNPNLSPTILGGQENLGYYKDRLGNLIMAPGAVRPPGFALGGEVTDEEEDYGEQDVASARAMLDRLSSEAPEFRAIPTKRRARRQEAERGSAKGMAMELEQMSKPQGPRTKRQAEELRQKMELLRDTLGMPTLTRAGLAREGELLAQRFAEGGEAESSWLPLQTRTYLESVIGSDKKTAPLTEKSFSAKELAKLRELIALAEERPVSSKKTGKPLPGVVSYAHHTEQIRRNNPETGLPLSMVDSDFNPAESANLRNTLGTFSFERMPDGSIIVKDAYDYTGDIAEEGNPLIQFANWRGVNRPVSVRLPSEPKKGKR